MHTHFFTITDCVSQSHTACILIQQAQFTLYSPSGTIQRAHDDIERIVLPLLFSGLAEDCCGASDYIMM